MKRLLIIIALIFIPAICTGQGIYRFHYAKDTMATTDYVTDSTYMDTLVYANIDVSQLAYFDTLGYLRFLFKLDTTEDTTAAQGQAWSDSGHIPDLIAEMRYVLDKSNKIANDTISSNGAGAGQWVSIMDTCTTIGDWGFSRFSIMPISRYIDVRIRDKSDARKRGNKHGKWFESMIEGLRRRNF